LLDYAPFGPTGSESFRLEGNAKQDKMQQIDFHGTNRDSPRIMKGRAELELPLLCANRG
jgi:hypothetical protein